MLREVLLLAEAPQKLLAAVMALEDLVIGADVFLHSLWRCHHVILRCEQKTPDRRGCVKQTPGSRSGETSTDPL